ncbi:CPBP family intramembrane glutamic endopeptidase [Salinimicrobium sediminilitoris]|uniref:CPBP family intramembrane glutamic endopeptidase n=1 Tax=Salinimicrobium sediminilitoris TaxID=2876715 RepID=UPI001E586143|nr:CPBP family intramembrane glutamic endopeptidase [Salinimicrobium sediminilitoris]MCC8361169.1 CPBP family intramembrane metalloprotease [Salinimicrobium sediminilitoris]
MKKLYKDIYAWIKNPDDNELNLSSKRKFLLTFQILLLELLLAFPFIGFIYFIHSHVVKLENPLIDWGPYLTIFLVILVIPFIEEIIFRFPLKYQRNYLARLLNYLSKGRLKKRWNSIFKYLLYLLAVLFGLIHLTNYNNTETIFYILSPVIIGSQLIGGFLLSYVRIKLGFLWSVFQHGAFNFTLIILSIIFLHNNEIVRISNKTLSINIKELVFVNKYDSYFRTKFGEDEIYLIEANDISLYDFIDSLNLEGPRPYDDKWIDVNIYGEDGITKTELEKFLKREIKFDK